MNKRLTQVTNVILIFFALLGLVVMAHSAKAYIDHHILYFKYHKLLIFFFFGAIPFLGAAYFYRKPTETKLSFCIMYLFTYLTLAVGDFVSIHFKPDATKKYIATLAERAAKKGIKFDTRSFTKVVLDKIAEGKKDFLPRTPPNLYWGKNLKVDGKDYVPMHDIPASNVVVCNEKGDWLSYKMDRYGFNNRDSKWNIKKFDVALIGDSFTWGNCVEPQYNIQNQLSQILPKTISLGSGGNGPYTELASLREFQVAKKSAKHYFWIYYEGNDLQDMEQEEVSSIIKKYVEDPSFNQNAFARIKKIRPVIRAAAKKQMEEAVAKGQVADHFHIPIKTRIKRAIVLSNIRQLTLELIQQPRFQPRFRTFNRIIERAKKDIDAHGGKLTFVFLPTHTRYVLKDINSHSYHRHGAFRNIHYEKQQILDIVKRLDIEVIDIDRVFLSKGDPRNFFFYDSPTHYTEEGYKIVTEAIIDYLKKNRLIANRESRDE